jgi:hypothetical protein
LPDEKKGKSMRLTLRTLLAYLDDTLDPAEIRAIGQKVKESDAAQELVARIRQVTRRRRLTAPPATGPGAKFDPNTIAEYLDNVLPPDQVADVEKTCLESDVHLAEIAACHQILTLVLGEPALVPPTARQRMYALVRGREAIPYRRAPVAGNTGEGGEGGESEADDTLLLGLPFWRRRGGLFAVLMPAAAVLLAVLLGTALWFAVPSSGPPPVVNAKGPARELPVSNPIPKKADDPKIDDKKPDDKKPPEPPGGANDKKPDDSKKPDDGSRGAGNPPAEPPRPPEDLLKERREAAQILMVKDRPNMLLRRQEPPAPGKDGWVRLGPEKQVSTGDLLVSLPGYRTTLRCKNGLDLMLWGNVPDVGIPLPLMESAVVLNNNPNVGLDFTLDRGRVLVTSQNPGPTPMRVRFGGSPPSTDEVWDVILESPGTEVVMELMGRAVADPGFRGGLPPYLEFNLLILKGEATVKRQRRTWGIPQEQTPMLFAWNNREGVVMPRSFPKEYLARYFSKDLPDTPEVRQLNAAMDTLLPGPREDKPIELVLDARLQSPQATPAQRMLAVYCLGALDLLPTLLDHIDAEERADVRQKAVLALVHWLGRKAAQGEKLFNTLVSEKMYKESQATTVLQLLHGFKDKELVDPQTWDTLIFFLKSKRPTIRELAYYHLIRTVPQARGSDKYDPGTNPEAAYAAWKQLIPDGQLPPSLRPMPPGGEKPPK